MRRAELIHPGIVQNLSKEVLRMTLAGQKIKELVKNGEFIYELLAKVGINFDNVADIIRLVEVAQEMLSQGNGTL